MRVPAAWSPHTWYVRASKLNSQLISFRVSVPGTADNVGIDKFYLLYVLVCLWVKVVDTIV